MSTKLTVLLIPCDEEQQVRPVEVRQGNLEDIYDKVAPDSRVFTAVNGTDFSLYGDDEGMFHPQVEHRVNARAMQLLAQSAGLGLDAFRSPLVGDFLAFGLPDGEGESTSVPQRVLDFKFSWTTKKPAS